MTGSYNIDQYCSFFTVKFHDLSLHTTIQVALEGAGGCQPVVVQRKVVQHYFYSTICLPFLEITSRSRLQVITLDGE